MITFPIYLPIAEVTVDAVQLLVIGAMVGCLSGMVGVGGGFLMTPILIFLGIPPAIAVASEANQIVGSSSSAGLVHMRRGNMDRRMGMIIICGGLIGSAIGVWLFRILREMGYIDVFVSLTFILLLSIIGFIMLFETARSFLSKRPSARPSRLVLTSILHRLPFKMRFRVSRVYVSILLPFVLGIFVGILSALLGVGGGVILIPAMIYLLRMPTLVVVGTSLLYTMVIATSVTIMHAAANHTVDVVLAFLLIIGGVVGAQLGSRLAPFIRAEQFRIIMAMLILAVAGKLAYDLTTEPLDPYVVRYVLS